MLLLLLVAAWQFWGWASPAGQLDAANPESMAARMPPFGGSQVILALLIAAGAYAALQFMGRSSLALWMAAVLTLAPQAPGVWAHNNLAWERFTGATTTIGDGHPEFLAGGLFVASLLGLFVLHRVIAMRTLGVLLADRRVDHPERIATLKNEGSSLTGILGLALLLALVLVGAGTVLGRSEWLTNMVPWTVVTVGGGASLLLIGFIALFLRGLMTQEGTESGPDG